MNIATVHHADAFEVLAGLADNSIHACLTDPPYNLSFMGSDWDSHDTPHDFQLWCQRWATEVFRVLKPGGFLLAFGSPRTVHRLVSGVEDAGFEIRSMMYWHFGNGKPAGLDASKAVDAKLGAERVLTPVGAPVKRMIPGNVQNRDGSWDKTDGRVFQPSRSVPVTAEAAEWDGWNTGLKPATEPIVVARKPLDGDVAGNLLQHGVGALNIDGCRTTVVGSRPGRVGVGVDTPGKTVYGSGGGGGGSVAVDDTRLGRWPSDMLLTHAADCARTGDMWVCDRSCPIRLIDVQSGEAGAAAAVPAGLERVNRGVYNPQGVTSGHACRDDPGGASKFTVNTFFTVDDVETDFMYQAKASRRERPETVDGIRHPTVKPLNLVRHLARLICPPDGTLLDPFAGSGTTVEAALIEGFDVVAVENQAKFVPLIEARVARFRNGETCGLVPASERYFDASTSITRPAVSAPESGVQPSLFDEVG